MLTAAQRRGQVQCMGRLFQLVLMVCILLFLYFTVSLVLNTHHGPGPSGGVESALPHSILGVKQAGVFLPYPRTGEPAASGKVAHDVDAHVCVPVRGGLAVQPTRAELGHSTWTFLHKMVARFPDDPTPVEQEKVGCWHSHPPPPPSLSPAWHSAVVVATRCSPSPFLSLHNKLLSWW
jgi:hypothetical protein